MHTPSFICITSVGFVANIAWGVVMPSLWSYISSVGGTQLDLGIAISVFSLAQIFFLQIFGKWADKRSIRESLLISFCVGITSYILYSAAHIFAPSPYMIIFARFLAGIEAGNLTITNSFVAVCSTHADRTKYMAKMNGINVFGFIIAPAFNYVIMRTNFKIGGLLIDPFVASGFLIACLHVFNILMFLFIFKDPKQNTGERESLLHSQKKKDKAKQKEKKVRVAEIKRENNHEIGEEEAENLIAKEEGALPLPRRKSVLEPTTTITKRQFISVAFTKVYGVCFIATFVQNFLFSVLVTIITPITKIKYHFNTFENSLIFSATSVIMVLVIFLASVFSHLSKNIDRAVILVSQFFMGASLVCIAVFLPENDLSFFNMCLIVVLLVIGVPGQNTSITSIYSKFITLEYGTAKLGELTGLLFQVGSIAGVLGPLWAGFAYNFSPVTLVSVMYVMLIVAISWTVLYFSTLVLPVHPIPAGVEAQLNHPMNVARRASIAATQKLARQSMSSPGLLQFALFADNEAEEEIVDEQGISKEENDVL